MDLKEQFLQKMIAEKLDFLPLEEALQLFDSGVEVKTRLNYAAFMEEVEDGGDCGRDFLFSELDERYGIYDDNGKFKVDDYTLRLVANDDESFIRILCPAPTIGDLLKTE